MDLNLSQNVKFMCFEKKHFQEQEEEKKMDKWTVESIAAQLESNPALCQIMSACRELSEEDRAELLAYTLRLKASRE